MEWNDTGIVLGARRHGEAHAIVELLTPTSGRCAGLVYGGQSTAKKALLQPGNRVAATWKGRIETNLGHYALELVDPGAARLMMDTSSLLALQSVCALIGVCTPEREPNPDLYEATDIVLKALEIPDVWPVILAKWEVGLLSMIGFALDLSCCTVTGQLLEEGADLVFVSPKSGKAVTYEAGLPYQDKLLPLPPFLIDRGTPTRGEVVAAFELSGYFLEKNCFSVVDKELPEPRRMLLARLGRWAQAGLL